MESRFIRLRQRRVRPGRCNPEIRKLDAQEIHALSGLLSFAGDVFRVMGGKALTTFPDKKEIETDAANSVKPFELQNVQRILLDDPRHYIARQASYEFNKPEMKQVFRKFFGKRIFRGRKKPRIVVFAGYSGEFSKALQELGFEVIHTDGLREYSKRTDMPSYNAYAHRIPRINRVTAFVSFEPGAVFNGSHALPFMLKALSESEKGFLFMNSRQTKNIIHPEFKNDQTLSTMDEFFFEVMSKLYGAEYKRLLTEREIYHALTCTPKQRQLIAFDLKVLNFISANPQKYLGN